MADSLKSHVEEVKAAADSATRSRVVDFAWPERFDQWIIWGLGLAIATTIGLIRFAKGRERRHLVLRLQDENCALIALLEQLATYLSKNPRLPGDGLRSLNYRLRAMEPMRDRFSILRREELRRGLPAWFDALDKIVEDGAHLNALDQAMHEAQDFREHHKPFKLAKNALSEHILRTLEVSRVVREQLAQERYGILRQFIKDRPIEVPETGWTEIGRRDLRVRLSGVVTSAYIAATIQDSAAREGLRRVIYSTKRFLDRVIAAVEVVGSGGTGSELSTSHLDEIILAAKDFESGAGDLHLLTDSRLGSDLSAFAVQLRHGVAEVRKSEAAIAESWAKAHAKRIGRGGDLDYWFKSLLPPAHDFSDRGRRASIDKVKSWREAAAQLLLRIGAADDVTPPGAKETSGPG